MRDHCAMQSKCAVTGTKSSVRGYCGSSSLRGRWKLTPCGECCLREEDGEWGEGREDDRWTDSSRDEWMDESENSGF